MNTALGLHLAFAFVFFGGGGSNEKFAVLHKNV